MEVTLKEASGLCKKSEKTLRRKIEAGLLEGRKEPLEFGGFMWVIDVESLDELYPGSRPNNLPQVYAAPEPPQVRLKSRGEEDTPVSQHMVAQREILREDFESSPEAGEHDEDEDESEEWNARQSFLDYILEENRGLKSDLKARDAHILNLNERALILERALGEQEGKAITQSRILEWFQSQESDREKHRNESERKLLEAGPQVVAAPAKTYLAALGGITATLVLLLVFLATGLVSFQF